MSEKQIVALMIPKEEVSHYLATTNLSALWRRIASTHNGCFYGLICLHLFRTNSKLESHSKVYEKNVL